LSDVLERQGISLNSLSKLVMTLILEKRFVVLEYFVAAFEQVWMCSFIELLIALNIQESRLNAVE